MAASSSSPSSSLPIHLLLVALSLLSPAMPATFTITNNCEYGVWPGILSGAGTPAPASTGFALRSGESASLEMPASWSGRLWGRTLCSSDPATGRFSCATGDCGTGAIPCSGSGASPPATLAEFTLDGSGGMDFFDVSLVDGYNLPVLVVPRAASSAGKCAATGCAVDVNGICPPELKVTSTDEGGRSVACRSACDAFGRAEFCCSGDHASPNTCGPTRFSQFFKSACPRAYSYAYDDGSSTFTCATGTDYLITFCPTIPSQKAGENIPATAGEPLINDTMVFMGATDDTSSVSARARPIVIVAISAISAVLFPAPIQRRFF